MSSKLKQFQRKWGTKEEDTKVMREKAEKNLEENFLGVEGADMLGQQGNMKEAAAVFTREGIKVFGQIFGNSVREAIKEELPNVVRKAIRDEMTEILYEAAKEVRAFGEQMGVSFAKTAVQETVEEMKEMVEDKMENITDVPEVKIEKPKRTKKSNKPTKNVKPLKPSTKQEEINIILGLLKQYPKGVKLVEMVKTLTNVSWGTNPTNRMAYFIKLDSRIGKMGKGVYCYLYSQETSEIAVTSELIEVENTNISIGLSD